MSATTPTASWRTWLQLLRAPNLFTVPGDPLAGFLLATGGHLDHRLPLAIGASLCFYSHGLLVNDLADLAEDRRDRPNRPLPSGAASVRAVLIAAIVLALLALAFCYLISQNTLYIGLALLAAVVVYNLWAKKIPILGPINMGLCRGLSIFLGTAAGIYEFASADGRPAAAMWSTLLALAVFAATGVTLYIAAITHLARIETLADPPKLPRTLPFVTLFLVIVAFFVAAIDRTQPLRYTNIWLYLIGAYTVYAGFKIHQRLTRQPPPPIPPIIGQLIRLLLPLQAIFCLASRSVAGAISAVSLLILWPIAKSVSRRFYAS
ncbi:MAG: UbiA family prenyltransferase [Chthoniobacter sp.]|nr:UbiA family prenyltransferase [Chthoniobacter sp.]